jgi:hypothetical protein
MKPRYRAHQELLKLHQVTKISIFPPFLMEKNGTGSQNAVLDGRLEQTTAQK